MKTFTVIVYSDAGHAWGKVKRQVLVNLGIADKVSTYSYQYKDNVYLEEDYDLRLLMEALPETTRIKFVEKHTDNNSRIRSYEQYATQSNALDHMFPDLKTNLSNLTISN
jgi:hypothetical protein